MEKFLTGLLAYCSALMECYMPDNKLYKQWKEYQRVKAINNCHKRLVLEINLNANDTSYPIPQYQRLNNTRLIDVSIPTSTYFTKSFKNKDIASVDAHANGFLNLQDNRSSNINELIPGINFLQGYQATAGFVQEKRTKFDHINIDWTKSTWQYPSTTIPTANAGKSVIIIVTYIDLNAPEGYVEQG